MTIRISKKMQDALPEEERAGIKDFLWSKSGGICFLCDQPMNQASDAIVADHDHPEHEDGPTLRTNLNLVHSSCNSAKRNNPSVDIRPYLKLRAYMEEKGDPTYYTDCLAFFEIVPKPVVIQRKGSQAEFHFSDGSISKVPVFSEKSQDGSEFEFVFVALPRDAIFNDHECQPRSIKSKQLLLIYSDLSHNPLHEPPGLRLSDDSDETKLLMFDGQHKTLAKWMAFSKTVVSKVYLDLTKDQANYLVNSVQSRVKKLPLTPLELAAKMADEFSAKYEEYSKESSEEISEAGFIKWLPANDRTRGKAEIRSAVIKLLLENDDPAVQISDRVGQSSFGIPEPALLSKVFKPMAKFEPLDVEQSIGDEQRSRERQNIAVVLNLFDEICISPGTQAGASEGEKERSRRMLYQASLEYCMKQIKLAIAHFYSAEADDVLLEKSIKGDELEKIKEAIFRLRDHPIWTADFSSKPNLKDVGTALSENRGTEKAFRTVGLRLGYLTGADILDSDWDG